MKRYIFGLAAVVAATAAVAFTNPEATIKPSSVTFYFTGNPLISGQVADESLWSTTSPGGTCGSTANKACQIIVNDNQTQVVDGQTVLKSTLNIMPTAGAGGATNGYVPQLTTGITSITNKP